MGRNRNRNRPHPDEHPPEEEQSPLRSTGELRRGDEMDAGTTVRESLPLSAAPAPARAPWLPSTLPLPAAGPDVLELLATLRHEFFTPLTVIDGYTSTLLRQRQQLAPDEQT